MVILSAAVEAPVLALERQELRRGDVFRHIRTREPVDVEITIVAEDDPPLRIGHDDAMAQIVQCGTDKRVLARLQPLDPAQRRMDPKRN